MAAQVRAYGQRMPLPCPLGDLVIVTPRLRLQALTGAQSRGLAERACGNVLTPADAAFQRTWMSLPAGEFKARFMIDQEQALAERSPASWRLSFGVFPAGCDEPVGVQDLLADAFPERRTVSTGSWLVAGWQGRGLGSHMRAAVLTFAFEHLRAAAALTSAHERNTRSRRVTERLGYRLVERAPAQRCGERFDEVHYRLDAGAFTGRVPIRVSGLGSARALLGA